MVYLLRGHYPLKLVETDSVSSLIATSPSTEEKTSTADSNATQQEQSGSTLTRQPTEVQKHSEDLQNGPLQKEQPKVEEPPKSPIKETTPVTSPEPSPVKETVVTAVKTTDASSAPTPSATVEPATSSSNSTTTVSSTSASTTQTATEGEKKTEQKSDQKKDVVTRTLSPFKEKKKTVAIVELRIDSDGEPNNEPKRERKSSAPIPVEVFENTELQSEDSNKEEALKRDSTPSPPVNQKKPSVEPQQAQLQTPFPVTPARAQLTQAVEPSPEEQQKATTQTTKAAETKAEDVKPVATGDTEQKHTEVPSIDPKTLTKPLPLSKPLDQRPAPPLPPSDKTTEGQPKIHAAEPRLEVKEEEEVKKPEEVPQQPLPMLKKSELPREAVLERKDSAGPEMNQIPLNLSEAFQKKYASMGMKEEKKPQVKEKKERKDKKEKKPKKEQEEAEQMTDEDEEQKSKSSSESDRKQSKKLRKVESLPESIPAETVSEDDSRTRKVQKTISTGARSEDETIPRRITIKKSSRKLANPDTQDDDKKGSKGKKKEDSRLIQSSPEPMPKTPKKMEESKSADSTASSPDPEFQNMLHSLKNSKASSDPDLKEKDRKVTISSQDLKSIVGKPRLRSNSVARFDTVKLSPQQQHRKKSMSSSANDSFMIPIFPGVVMGVTNVVEFSVTQRAKLTLQKYNTMRMKKVEKEAAEVREIKEV